MTNTDGNFTILSAGNPTKGQLGRGGNNSVPSPVALPTSQISCLSNGNIHSVVLCKDGSVLWWGQKNGSFSFEEEDADIPTKIKGLPFIIDVKCGDYFTLFLTKEKKVLISSYYEKNHFTGIKIPEPAVALFGYEYPWIVGESGAIYFYEYNNQNFHNVVKFGPYSFGVPKQIVSTWHSVVLITSSGEALGMSMSNLIPKNDHPIFQIVPKNVKEFVPIKSLWGVKIRKVVGNELHYLAISEDNQVFKWGITGMFSNFYKSYFTGFNIHNICRDAKFIDIATAKNHSLCVDSSGHVWGFGNGEYGQTLLKDDTSFVSNLIEKAVAVHCGSDFSLVEVGEYALPEAGSLNLELNSNHKPHNFQENNELVSRNPMKFNDNLRIHDSSQLNKIRDLEEKLLKSKQKISSLKETIRSFSTIQKQYEELKTENEYKNVEISELHQQIQKLTNEIQSQISTSSPKIMSQKEIESFNIIKTIGSGSSANVVKVSQEQFYALKILKLENIDEEDSESDSYHSNQSYDGEEETNKQKFKTEFEKLQYFMKEYEIICQISHKNIIKTYGICYGNEKNPPSILLEYCPFNLKKRVKKLNDENRYQIISEIIEGMSYIHERGLIHRDLKPENILLDSENHVKICDFRISTLSSDTSHTGGIGTLAYMSPEQLNGDKHYTNKVDVYAFGIILYFILTNGSIPNISVGDIVKGKQIHLPTRIPDFYRRMIKKCLSFAPKDRPDFSELHILLSSSK
ncbi:hypothetical protein TRFO_13366 [Tritrichomonas foetus]|uniref:Protein kinase domain-containing protein n=1 Tax=Tritrichomonas foetus TaxID=1144522 RepID=A0A1J4KY93_9EUKA|nr:hypothetical protein TRFO_13366 [Tritrichomonas foetus]|eukprot:OHT16207.1 hypothetical protein TRFO_13366 [Tritrichomonas foetus]